MLPQPIGHRGRLIQPACPGDWQGCRNIRTLRDLQIVGGGEAELNGLGDPDVDMQGGGTGSISCGGVELYLAICHVLIGCRE